jgi:hypothetical protein
LKLLNNIRFFYAKSNFMAILFKIIVFKSLS